MCSSDLEILKMAIEKCRPSTQQVEFMTMLAIRETDDKDLLPERYKYLLDDKENLKDLEEYKR